MSGTQVRDGGSQFPLPAQGQGSDGILRSLPSIPFRPQGGEGQVLAIGPASVRTAVLTITRAHWVFATKHAWINTGGAAVVAAALDFPLPSGAVAEYVPYAANQYIAVIETAESAGDPGNLYVGRSEA